MAKRKNDRVIIFKRNKLSEKEIMNLKRDLTFIIFKK